MLHAMDTELEHKAICRFTVYSTLGHATRHAAGTQCAIPRAAGTAPAALLQPNPPKTPTKTAVAFTTRASQSIDIFTERDDIGWFLTVSPEPTLDPDDGLVPVKQ